MAWTIGTILLVLFIAAMVQWVGVRPRHAWAAIRHAGDGFFWIGAILHDFSAVAGAAEDAAAEEWQLRTAARRTAMIVFSRFQETASDGRRKWKPSKPDDLKRSTDLPIPPPSPEWTRP